MNETRLEVDSPSDHQRITSARPPLWLVVSTGGLAVTCLVLAIAETNLWAHYLIDGGEFLSLCGLAFIALAGWHLFRTKRLFVSLPLALPWLLYPIISQGDQIIDNLSINPMRLICHLLLAGIFGTPVAVVVLAVRYFYFGPGAMEAPKSRRNLGLLGIALLALELWVAHQFLGTLMVVTQLLMIGATAMWTFMPPAARRKTRLSLVNREQVALVLLLAGVLFSAGLYLGFKNRAGAYQGSPSAFMDPSQREAFYPLTRIAVPANPPTVLTDPAVVEKALTGQARTLEALLAGYHILDRNYTYDFHNRLFLRHTSLLPDYRATGLKTIQEAQNLKQESDSETAAARSTLPAGDPVLALMDDLQGYIAFNFNRAIVLERLSAEFERTPAGLQHAAHLYEGESKELGVRLESILNKHHAVMESPTTASVVQELSLNARQIYSAYSHHVVGF